MLLTCCLVKIEGGIVRLVSVEGIAAEETNPTDLVSLDGDCEVSVHVRRPAVVGDREYERLSK